MGSKKLFLILEKVVLFLVIFLATFSLPYNPDLGWHLRNGEEILRTGSVVQGDLFSHTLPGFEFVNHSWLTDVFLFLVHSRFGLVGIAVFSSLVLALALTFPLLVLGVSLFPALISLSVFWLLLRPDYRGFQAQFLSLFFLSLVLIVWEKGLVARKKLAWLPVLFFLWSNFHGGAPVGLATLLVLIGSRWLVIFKKKNFFRESVFLVLVFSFSLLATVLNPAGIKYWENFYLHLRDPVQREYIVEWRSLPLGDFRGVVFGVSFWLATVAGIRFLRKRPALLLLALFFGLSGFFVRRNLPFWGLYFVFLVGGCLRSWRFPIKISLDSRARAGLALLVLFFSLVFFLPKIKEEVGVESSWEEYCSRVPTFCPAGAVEFLSGVEMKGKMFNLYSWGGFLIWQVPQYSVFVDGRMATWKKGEVYPFYDQERIIRLVPGWEEILSRYDVSWAVIPANPYLVGEREHDLVFALKEKGWVELYRDAVASVLERRS